MRDLLLLSSLLLQTFTAHVSAVPGKDHHLSLRQESSLLERRQTGSTSDDIGDGEVDDADDGVDIGTAYKIPGTDLQLLIVDGDYGNIAISGGFQQALTDNLAYINSRVSAKDGPLKDTYDEPYVFKYDSNSSLSSSNGTSGRSRYSIVAVNTFGTPDITFANLSAVFTGLQSYVKTQKSVYTNGIRIFQVADSKSSLLGTVSFNQSATATVPSLPASSASSVLTMDVPQFPDLQIKYNTLNTSVKGNIDAATMGDQLSDITAVVQEYLNFTQDGLVTANGNNPWTWTTHGSPTDQKGFQVVMRMLQDVHWSTLGNVTATIRQQTFAQGIWSGGAVTVVEKSSQKVLIDGFVAGKIVANGTLLSGPPTSGNSSAVTPSSGNSSTVTPGPADTRSPGNLVVSLNQSSLTATFPNNQGDHSNDDCKKFTTQFDSADNAFVKAYAYYNESSAQQNFEYLNFIQAVNVPAKLGGKDNSDKIGAVASFTPCSKGKNGDCPAGDGIYGADIFKM